MQVNETANEGLKRAYEVTVGAAEIEAKLNAKLAEVGRSARMPGFRPGKVPMKVLRQQYGKRLIGEVVEEAVNETSQRALSEREVTPALRPKIEITSFEDGGDLTYKMDVEVLPETPEVTTEAIRLNRPVASVPDEEVESALNRLAEQHRHYHEIEEDRPAQEGDQAVLDFTGYVDGEAFEGGAAQDFPLVLGSKSLIPGFEEQVIGKRADESFDIEVTFPEDYGQESLAGKAATFKSALKAIKAPHEMGVSDELAKHVGLEDEAQLREQVRQRLQERFDQASRLKVKRQLLDHLAETYRFDVPPGMVDMEFDQIWQQLQQEMARNKESFDETGDRSEEAVRGEYKSIAERRVRLGLLLSSVGNAEGVKVEPQELQQAVMEQARQFPGDPKPLFDYYRSNPQALEQLRAPIFEEKVVDLLIERADVTEETVSPEDLLRDPEDETAEAEGGAGEDAPEGLPPEEADEGTKAAAGPAVVDPATGETREGQEGTDNIAQAGSAEAPGEAGDPQGTGPVDPAERNG